MRTLSGAAGNYAAPLTHVGFHDPGVDGHANYTIDVSSSIRVCARTGPRTQSLILIMQLAREVVERRLGDGVRAVQDGHARAQREAAADRRDHDEFWCGGAGFEQRVRRLEEDLRPNDIDLRRRLELQTIPAQSLLTSKWVLSSSGVVSKIDA